MAVRVQSSGVSNAFFFEAEVVVDSCSSGQTPIQRTVKRNSAFVPLGKLGQRRASPSRRGTMRGFFRIIPVLVAIEALTGTSTLGFHLDPSPDPEPPFVVCEHQRYALCAEATCFVYDGVAYCKCEILKGDSISLQLSYSSTSGERNVCDVNRQGKTNGYMVSTFSFPNNVEKGGPAAVYTCPGPADAGNGLSAPVAYGQCDGGLSFKSTKNRRFPGFIGRLRKGEIICSCPIATDATPGSSDSFGYQVFGPYHPEAAKGSRCDASACAVPNPTANGAAISVGAATGSAKFLTLKLDGPPVPDINECLCACQATGTNGVVSCSVGEDRTP
jgi:hypothetical protein